MKSFFALTLLTALLTFSAHADCTLAIKSSDFNLYGNVLHFGDALRPALEEKKFVLITLDEAHHYEFDFSGEDIEGNPFHHAIIRFWITNL